MKSRSKIYLIEIPRDLCLEIRKYTKDNKYARGYPQIALHAFTSRLKILM